MSPTLGDYNDPIKAPAARTALIDEVNRRSSMTAPSATVQQPLDVTPAMIDAFVKAWHHEFDDIGAQPPTRWTISALLEKTLEAVSPTAAPVGTLTTSEIESIYSESMDARDFKEKIIDRLTHQGSSPAPADPFDKTHFVLNDKQFSEFERLLKENPGKLDRLRELMNKTPSWQSPAPVFCVPRVDRRKGERRAECPREYWLLSDKPLRRVCDRRKEPELASAIRQASNILFNLEQASGPGAALDPRQRECCKEVREKLDRLTRAQKPREVHHAAPGMTELGAHGSSTQVGFYEREFYPLSNFSAFRVYWADLDFDTSEAAYHYEKFRGVDADGPKWKARGAIRRARSAHDAFKIAEQNREHRRPDWDSVKVDIMRQIIRAKAEQHEYVRRKLLETGDRELIEDSWRDDFWGWGPNHDGQNMLGKLWMELRAELRLTQQAAPSPTIVRQRWDVVAKRVEHLPDIDTVGGGEPASPVTAPQPGPVDRERIARVISDHLRLTMFDGQPAIEVPSLLDAADALISSGVITTNKET